MAGYFKKRRRNDGPSKNEEKVQRNQRRSASSGTLAERFPTVSRLSVKISFLDNQGHPLEERSLSWGPEDACELTLNCMGRCGVGTFDLSEKVRQAVEATLPETSAAGACAQTLYAGLPDQCGCQLRCVFQLAYAAKPASA
ncbi:MAG TPA: hypothetical protein VNI01_05585 [Elusimicrobiota bacterium]|jgi:hypothetical protein|nr:hypothetical protein [Elusimicrobiota bacterium]